MVVICFVLFFHRFLWLSSRPYGPTLWQDACSRCGSSEQTQYLSRENEVIQRISVSTLLRTDFWSKTCGQSVPTSLCDSVWACAHKETVRCIFQHRFVGPASVCRLAAPGWLCISVPVFLWVCRCLPCFLLAFAVCFFLGFPCPCGFWCFDLELPCADLWQRLCCCKMWIAFLYRIWTVSVSMLSWQG